MSQEVIVGRFGAAHGVRGWIKVHSFTNPKANLLEFRTWLIQKGDGWVAIELENTRLTNDTILVKLHNCDTPETARLYTNNYIAVKRSELPSLPEGNYYWVDLEGLSVINQQNVQLGTVKSVIATGSNDVLEVIGERKRLIPYLTHVIKKVDLQNKVLLVDWDESF